MSHQGGNRGRRTFLKRTGVVGSALLASGLAGCTGGGGGGDGGSDGGSGQQTTSGSGGGDGSSGGSTTQKELTTISMDIPPLAPAMVALKHIRDDTDILNKEMTDAGYKIDMANSWDDTTLYASGKADFVPTLSDLEGARIATERNIQTVFHGLFATNYEGLYTQPGSPYDPANTGSAEASLKKMHEDNAVWANAGWNQGSIGPAGIILKEKFGYQYGPSDSKDFNVKNSDWFTLPKLLAEGKVDVITNAPPLGAATQLTKSPPPIKAFLWYQPYMRDLGYGGDTINLGNFGTTKEFSDNHIEAIKAFMTAWKQGVDYISNTDNFDKILSDSKNVDYLGNNKDEARIVLEFSQDPPSHSQTTPGNYVPIQATNITIDDAYVKRDKKTLTKAHELGLLPDGWADHIEYKTLKI